MRTYTFLSVLEPFWKLVLVLNFETLSLKLSNAKNDFLLQLRKNTFLNVRLIKTHASCTRLFNLSRENSFPAAIATYLNKSFIFAVKLRLRPFFSAINLTSINCLRYLHSKPHWLSSHAYKLVCAHNLYDAMPEMTWNNFLLFWS